MKLKKLVLALTAVAVLQLSACNNSNNVETTTEKLPRQTTIETSDTTKVFIKNSDNPIEELNNIVAKDVEDTLDALYSEYEQLKSDIDTYNKYASNTDKMEAFYERVYDVHKNLCIKMYEYSLDYVNIIIDSDMSPYDMYDELDELYDSIYDDAGDDIYDGVYNGLLDDMYDDYYDGILDIDYDDVDDYSEWSDIISHEYKLWSRTMSDVYDDWSDFMSDVYRFWSDVGSEIYKNDFDGVEKKIEKFQKDINKLKRTETSDEDTTN